MSKPKPAGGKKPAQGPSAPAEPPGPVFKPPLKPRRGLFYGLMGLFALWVGVLLTMYFTTVRSPGHAAGSHEQGGATVAREVAR